MDQRQRKFILFAAIAKILQYLIFFILPMLLSWLVDFGVIEKNGGVMVKACLIMSILGAIACALGIIASYLLVHIKSEIAYHMRKFAYDKAVFSMQEADYLSQTDTPDKIEQFLRPKKSAPLNFMITPLLYAIAAAIIFIGGLAAALGGNIRTGIVLMILIYVILGVKIIYRILGYVVKNKTIFKDREQLKTKLLDILKFSKEHIPPDGGNERAAYLRRGDILFEAVSFSYKDSPIPVLNGISLNIKAGEHFAIIGEAGAGKTTLVSLIYRLFDTSNGDLYINGVSVKDYKIADLRKKIGFVCARLSDNKYIDIFEGTIYNNIIISRPDAAETDVTAVAQTAKIDLDLTDIAEDGGVNLSREQNERILIARTLLKNPEIIILDDINLAPDGHYGITIIKTARTALGITAADRIAVMENGIITAVGTHSELIINSELYNRITQSAVRGFDKNKGFWNPP